MVDMMGMSSGSKAQRAMMKVGGKYNWIGQPERLIFLGRNWSGNGFWNQFEKVDEPGKVWCEVTDDQLSSFEETKADDDEETRLAVAHYRSEFERLATLASNCARSQSTDLSEWRADLVRLVAQAQRFLAT
jgi:hypothetical protein